MRILKDGDMLWVKIISCTKELAPNGNVINDWYQHMIGEEMEVEVFGSGTNFHIVATDEPRTYRRIKVADCVDITRKRKIDKLLEEL